MDNKLDCLKVKTEAYHRGFESGMAYTKQSLYTDDELFELLHQIASDLFNHISSKERDGLTPLEHDWTNKWFNEHKKKYHGRN